MQNLIQEEIGRRGDIIYLAPEHVTQADWDRGYPIHPPDLVIEVISEDDKNRDYVDKMREYALVGMAHYRIVDPRRKTIAIYTLQGDIYVVSQELGEDDILASSLFPSLEIPLNQLFRR